MDQLRKVLGRRDLVKVVGAAGVGLVTATACSAPSAQTTAASPAASLEASPAAPAAPVVDAALENRPQTMTADEAMQFLMDGNKRFAGGKAANPRHTYARVQDTANDEFPVAAVLCSSDSRVSPEVVFDQGIGDLYVARVFGLVASPEVQESMTYAVATLQVPLILVMGSDREAAVQAVLRDSSRVLANMKTLKPKIEPAVMPHRGKTDGSDLSASVKGHTKAQAKALAESPVLAKAIQDGKLKIVPIYYDLDDASIEVLEG